MRLNPNLREKPNQTKLLNDVTYHSIVPDKYERRIHLLDFLTELGVYYFSQSDPRLKARIQQVFQLLSPVAPIRPQSVHLHHEMHSNI